PAPGVAAAPGAWRTLPHPGQKRDGTAIASPHEEQVPVTLSGMALSDEVGPEAAPFVGEVADLRQVRVLVLLHLVQQAADAAPGGVAEGARHQDVAPRRRGTFLLDTGVGARQAGDERVEIPGRLAQPLVQVFLLDESLAVPAEGGLGGGRQD